MYEKRTLSGFVLFLTLATAVAANGIRFEELSLVEGLEKAKNEKKLLFIDVYATWCGPCKYLSEKVFVNEELGELINENFVSIKLDGEKGDGPQLMYDYGLDAYPTMLMLAPDEKLRKKIVGAVSADEIIEEAMEAIHPESTEIYKLEKKYISGDRSKELLKSYVQELKEEGRSYEELSAEYLELFPDLLLTDRAEFLIFSAQIHSLDNEYMKTFLTDAGDLRELHGELAEDKMVKVLMDLVERAQAEENPQLIKDGVDLLYAPYLAIFAENAYEKKRLIEVLLE